MENEIWRDIKGYEGLYQVSNLGRVKSLAHTIVRSNGWKQTFGERILKAKNALGYSSVTLCDRGKHRSNYVHRLVAEAFVPNPNGYLEVNHKNEDKRDNRAENIEWCTRQYNLLYGCRGEKSGHSLGRETVLVSESGEEIHFDRISRAAEFLGVTTQAVSQARRRNQRTKGYKVL